MVFYFEVPYERENNSREIRGCIVTRPNTVYFSRLLRGRIFGDGFLNHVPLVYARDRKVRIASGTSLG